MKSFYFSSILPFFIYSVSVLHDITIMFMKKRFEQSQEICELYESLLLNGDFVNIFQSASFNSRTHRQTQNAQIMVILANKHKNEKTQLTHFVFTTGNNRQPTVSSHPRRS